MSEINVSDPLAGRSVCPPSIYDEWLPSEAAALFLGLADITLKKSRESGILCGRKAPPYRKMGRGVRYRYADLVRWLESIPTQTVIGEHADDVLRVDAA